MSQDFFDTLDTLEQEASGGGGIVSKIRFDVGFKVFISGMAQEETFFAFKPGNEKDKAKALGLAKAALSAAGDTKNRPQMSVQFVVSKSDVKGREVTWANDRFFVFPLWTDAYKQLVKPALKAAGVKGPGEYWGRIGFGQDPSGRTELDQDGNERIAIVGYLVEIYEDEEAAEADAGSGGGGASSAYTVPDGWTAETWAEMVPTILEELGEEPTPKEMATVAKEYDISVADIKTLLGEV